MSDVLLRGVSGRAHRFSAHRPMEAFAKAPAVYAFARPGLGGQGWTVVFLSRTANLEARLRGHERWEEARRMGATHVLVHQREERDVREFVEADLLDALRPAMNVGETIALEDATPQPMEAAPPARRTLRLVWAA
jgi:hypothetical protein